MIDITELKKAAEAARKGEQKLPAITQAERDYNIAQHRRWDKLYTEITRVELVARRHPPHDCAPAPPDTTRLRAAIQEAAQRSPFSAFTHAALWDELSNALTELEQPPPLRACCGEFTKCERPCTPRGRWEQATADRVEREKNAVKYFGKVAELDRRQQFEAMARPLIKWLNDNCHPHMSVHIDNTSAELNEGQLAVHTKDYLKD